MLDRIEIIISDYYNLNQIQTNPNIIASNLYSSRPRLALPETFVILARIDINVVKWKWVSSLENH